MSALVPSSVLIAVLVGWTALVGMATAVMRDIIARVDSLKS